MLQKPIPRQDPMLWEQLILSRVSLLLASSTKSTDCLAVARQKSFLAITRQYLPCWPCRFAQLSPQCQSIDSRSWSLAAPVLAKLSSHCFSEDVSSRGFVSASVDWPAMLTQPKNTGQETTKPNQAHYFQRFTPTRATRLGSRPKRSRRRRCAKQIAAARASLASALSFSRFSPRIRQTILRI